MQNNYYAYQLKSYEITIHLSIMVAIAENLADITLEI